jgi:hypothetical protein
MGATPLCDAAGGKCVACIADADCSGATPVCDGPTHVCRACAADNECGVAAPVCAAGGACQACAAGKPGACAAAQKVCDVATATCVECVGFSDCSGVRPICDGATHTCRACGTSADCDPTLPVCLGTGACAACTATDTSRCTAAKPLCDTSGGGGVCVSCLGNADCGGTTPVCSAATHACVPCTADGGPSCPDPARPACQKTGPLAGACTECSATNATLCVGAQPQCGTATGLCGCSTDAACGGATSGLVCSGPNGFCTPGCGPGRNGCPGTETCVDVVAGLGRCAPATGCLVDGDCSAPLRRCDATEGAGRCVQCFANADCAAPFVCSTMTKTCVECTPTDQSACRADTAGARCVAGGSCGCTTDTDCGGTTSGRVCDAASARCIPGCRQTAGNGCPPSLSCTSFGNEVGVCQPIPGGSDGGMDGGPDGAPSDGGSDVPVDASPDASMGQDGAAGSDGAVATDGAAGTGGMAGMAGMGGTDAGVDAKTGPDGIPVGPNLGGYVAGGGCQCDASGAGGGMGGIVGIAVALATFFRRRRRA